MTKKVLSNNKESQCDRESHIICEGCGKCVPAVHILSCPFISSKGVTGKVNEKSLDLLRLEQLEKRIAYLEEQVLIDGEVIDELEERIDLLKEEPNIILKEIHNYHQAPVYIQPLQPFNPSYPIYCGGVHNSGTNNITSSNGQGQSTIY